jgi:hypothetical protein
MGFVGRPKAYPTQNGPLGRGPDQWLVYTAAKGLHRLRSPTPGLVLNSAKPVAYARGSDRVVSTYWPVLVIRVYAPWLV